jgi:hypothetical protein
MRRLALAAFSVAVLPIVAAGAQEGLNPDLWQQLTPQQREAARAKATERWRSMSPEEQAAARARMRERYESLPPERQALVRQRIQERRSASQK